MPAKKKAAKKPKKRVAAAKKKAATKVKRKTAAKAKKARKPAARKPPAARPKRVIVQFTRNGRNVGRPRLAPRGADDIHFAWRNPPGVFVAAWWTKGGRRGPRIPVPRGANDVHVRIR